jgi:transposase-like protein
MFLFVIGFNDLILLKSTNVRVFAFIIDEALIQIGNHHYWLWFCIEPVHSSILGIYISEERNMLVVEKFIPSLVEKYGRITEFTQMVVHGMMKYAIY